MAQGWIAGGRHPNDLDLRRIEKAIQARQRYRYVTPRVRPMAGGYRIESPCCSRNIDPDGGVVDIAMIAPGPEGAGWQLYRKDHAAGEWRLAATYDRLSRLLDQLNADPERQFWQ